MTDDSKKKPSIFDDLDKIRVAPDDLGTAGIEREVDAQIVVGRPSNRTYFRVHPEPTMSVTTAIIIDKEEMRNEVYFVAPAMRAMLAADLRHAQLVLAMTRQGVPMIWPLMLPIAGRANMWHERARLAAERAKGSWVRIVANVAAGGYHIFEAIAELPPPIWPDKPFNELLDTAFAGKIITDDSHPFVRRLLAGE